MRLLPWSQAVMMVVSMMIIMTFMSMAKTLMTMEH